MPRAWLAVAGGLAVLALAGPALAADADSAAEARAAMARIVEHKAARTAPVTRVETLDPAVIGALKAVPRHRFVPERVRRYAYAPTPLPLSQGHKIASPFLVLSGTASRSLNRTDRARC